jgi:hypothetical protein
LLHTYIYNIMLVSLWGRQRSLPSTCYDPYRHLSLLPLSSNSSYTLAGFGCSRPGPSRKHCLILLHLQFFYTNGNNIEFYKYNDCVELGQKYKNAQKIMFRNFKIALKIIFDLWHYSSYDLCFQFTSHLLKKLLVLWLQRNVLWVIIVTHNKRRYYQILANNIYCVLAM